MSVISGSSARTRPISSDAIPVVLGRPALEPVRLAGTEGLNKLFAYELLLKTPDGLNLEATGAADFDLDSFIGREIPCSLGVQRQAAELHRRIQGPALDVVRKTGLQDSDARGGPDRGVCGGDEPGCVVGEAVAGVPDGSGAVHDRGG